MSITSGQYYLLGPINTDVEFFFTYSGKANDGNTVAYFLTVIPGTGSDPDTFVFDPRINLAADVPTPSDPGSTCPNGAPGSCCLSQTDQQALTTAFNTACTSHCEGLPPTLEDICRSAQTAQQCEALAPQLVDTYNFILGQQPGCNTTSNSNAVPIGELVSLVASMVTGGWTFEYTLSGRPTMYLSVDSGGNLTSSISPTTFTVSQGEYADWSGVPFLAGVGYTFKVGDQQVTAQTYTADKVVTREMDGVRVPESITIVTSNGASDDMTVGVTTDVTSTVRAVPNIIIGTGTTSCEANDNAEQTQLVEAAWAFSGIGPTSWTTANDCRDGFRYNYCLAGSTCGTANCKGPCNSNGSTETCQYSANNNSFSCRRPGNDEPWWRQPWFIITLVIVGILFFILIIVLIVRAEHKSPQVRSTT